MRSQLSRNEQGDCARKEPFFVVPLFHPAISGFTFVFHHTFLNHLGPFVYQKKVNKSRV